MLTGGVILVQATGRGLVEERLNSIQEQAAIVVAGTIAQYATDPERAMRCGSMKPKPLLGQLIAPTRLRGRVYLPERTAGRSTPAISWRATWCRCRNCRALDRASRVKEWLKRLYDGVMGVRPFASLDPITKAAPDGRVYRGSRAPR